MSTLLATPPGPCSFHRGGLLSAMRQTLLATFKGRTDLCALDLGPRAALSIRVAAARSVIGAMVGRVCEFKIGNAIVLPVPVLVMDMLARAKRTAKVLGHNKSMLQNISGRIGHGMVRKSQPDVTIPRDGPAAFTPGPTPTCDGAVFFRPCVNASGHDESLLRGFSLKYNTYVKRGE